MHKGYWIPILLQTQFYQDPTNLAFGGVVATASLIFVYPLDFTRTRLAADIGKKADRKFTGLTDYLNIVYKTDDFAGLYRGFGITILGVVFQRAIYFGVYDSRFKLFIKRNQTQMVTFIAGFLLYLLDTIRRSIELKLIFNWHLYYFISKQQRRVLIDIYRYLKTYIRLQQLEGRDIYQVRLWKGGKIEFIDFAIQIQAMKLLKQKYFTLKGIRIQKYSFIRF